MDGRAWVRRQRRWLQPYRGKGNIGTDDITVLVCSNSSHIVAKDRRSLHNMTLAQVASGCSVEEDCVDAEADRKSVV